MIYHCGDVMGDPLNLVFVLAGQNLPHFFYPGQRVADAGQQVQNRRVHLVDLVRIPVELSGDRLTLPHNGGRADVGIRKRSLDES